MYKLILSIVLLFSLAGVSFSSPPTRGGYNRGYNQGYYNRPRQPYSYYYGGPLNRYYIAPQYYDYPPNYNYNYGYGYYGNNYYYYGYGY